MDPKITAAIITGVFSLLSPIVKWWLENRIFLKPQQTKAEEPVVAVPQGKPLNWRGVAAFALVGTVFGYVLGFAFSGTTPIPMPTPSGFPTPIPRGDLIMEIDFNQPGVGDCNDYKPQLLGYENNQYYIQPESNGYIAVCHSRDDLPPAGSLQVTAWSDTEPGEIFGYAVLFGWKGQGVVSTDLCMVGIRRKERAMEAFYSNRVSGEREAFTRELNVLSLDQAPHTLRVVLYPDGKAYGYLDERLFVETQFNACSDGPIGIMAWGPGDQKIYFDDLKLFALP